ncbi:MAG: EAL domain-containing protein [Gammaproteobacteria bacterium]|nr:EAL domain-containing protein [Gammaproteobacteria bacterium]
MALIPHTPETTPHTPRFWHLLCKMRIRQLLLLVLGLLTLISIMALGWNVIHVLHQYEDAEYMAGSSDIGQQALALNALLARERGLAAALLANPKTYNAKTKIHLKQLRQDADKAMYSLYQKLKENTSLVTIPTIHPHLDSVVQRLSDNRQQVDQNLNNNDASMTYSSWIDAISQRIEEIAMINRIVMAPVKEEEHASRYGIFIKEAFFSYSENAGHERALLSAVIAQQRSFRQEEYQQLDIYLHTSQLIEKRLNVILDFFPSTPAIRQARTELQRTYKEGYMALRTAIVQSSLNGQPYPITSTEWFNQATEAVNAILNLSDAVNLHINDDIDIIKNRSRNTIVALIITLLLVITIFIVAFMVTYRRILMPLQQLECSAHTISGGNLTQPIQILAQDEFGDVAEAFEVMRDYLFHDREKRQKAEYELRKLSTAIEQSVSSIIITDINGVTEYVNPQFYKTTGYKPEEAIGHKANLLRSDKTPLSTHTHLWDTIRSGQVWHGEILNKKKNGELFWELVSISPVRNREGQIANFIGIQHDITERKKLEERLNFMAYHDELTELPNRTLLLDRFEQLTTHAQRANHKVALLILDLDRFKLINDSLGHRIGDQLLIEIAKRLKHTARSSDTIARYGGDEFVILVSDLTDTDSLINLSKRLVDIISEPMTISEHHLHISASIGISIWPDDGDDMDTLLRLADTAMYHAKDLGRNQFQFYTPELNLQTSQRLRLENDLRVALDNQELELYYQPQVHLKDNKIIGAEALIRWNHPEFGLISPIQFIPLAEDTGLIRPIGEWVLLSACTQAMEWEKDGYSDLSIAVNVSVRQLDDINFLSSLKRTLQQSGLDAGRLEIEITESSVMEQPERMLEVLNTIKQLGIKLALDDFGTGYSSLSYLRRFPFDKLKIDRSFIKDITNKPEDAAITHTIGEMAHSLKMTVIAEGVETELQATYLRRSACDEIQGYLISKPVPAAEFMRLLQHPVQYFDHIEEDTSDIFS